MSAYIVVNISGVHDAAGYEDYKAKAPAMVRKHGGEYVVRGGTFEVVEGEWKPSRVVILRFPDMASAKAFIDDPEYRPLKKLRQSVCKTDMVVVEGLQQPIF
ncbi:MAG TPA: DUF1330 domain-containing protein [Terriglobales bacterium]